jgi:N-carbamoylputrescine amidase
VKVAVAQLAAEPLDPAANADLTGAAIADAAGRGAELIVLPEMIATGYVLQADRLRAQAESGDGSGPVLGRWRELARGTGVAVVGGFAELDGGRLFNSVAAIDASGEVVGCYRKLHLFGREKEVFEQGDRGLPIFELGGLQVGVLVCYDLRFPETVRLLALRGADLIATPTAWVGGFDTDEVPVDGTIGQVRGALVQANLSQVYIACADQHGATEEHRFLGSSLIASPYGDAAVGPAAESGDWLAVGDVDPVAVQAAQERAPGISPREDRRTDVYSLDLQAEGEPTPEQLLAEIERRRGYVLDIHRTLARLDPGFLLKYDDFLDATFLQERTLDRRTKELVYVGALMALATPKSHLVAHMRAAVAFGATEREVLEVVEQVLAPAGVARFVAALDAYEAAFPSNREERSD